MRRAIALIAGLVAMAASEGRAQTAEDPPVWAYLAECSAIFSAAAQSDGYAKVTGEQIADAQGAADRFLARAVEVAGEMGQADPAADVESIMAYLRPRWENRADSIVSVKSNLDWIAYCGRLGREQGVIAN